MAIRVSEFDAVRLARDAQVAGEAFGFEDVEGEMPTSANGGVVLWWLAGAAAFAGLIGYSFL